MMDVERDACFKQIGTDFLNDTGLNHTWLACLFPVMDCMIGPYMLLAGMRVHELW